MSIVHSFTQDLLNAICGNDRTLQGIKDVLLDHLMKRYKKGVKHTRFILSVERSDTPLTVNHYFADNVEKCRHARRKAELQKKAFWDEDRRANVLMVDTYEDQR